MKAPRRQWGTWVMAALLGAAGCADTSLETRKHERWLAYGSLPQEQRDWIERGEVAMGMSQEAVYIAWGKPTREETGHSPEGPWAVWWYGAAGGGGKPKAGRWSYQEIRLPDGRLLLLRRRAGQAETGRPAAEVRFLRGRVRGWQLSGSVEKLTQP